MHSDELPPEVRELLEKHIDSYEHLQLLAFLHAGRQREWSVEALSPHLQQPEQLPGTLASLQAGGLVRARRAESGTLYCYAPATPQHDAAVARLLEEHQQRPSRVMRLMSSNSIRRLRDRARRAFSDVFSRRRPKD